LPSPRFRFQCQTAHVRAQRPVPLSQLADTSSSAATLTRLACLIATYRSQLPVEISVDCFETSIDTVVAGHQVTLTTPVERWADDGRFVMQPPQVSDLPRQPEDGSGISWGQINEWRTAPPHFAGGWLRAVAFTFDIDAHSIGSQYSGAQWRPTGPVINGLFDLVPLWFDRFLSWIDVVSDQDTFVDTPHFLPSAQGDGLAVRASPPPARPNRYSC